VPHGVQVLTVTGTRIARVMAFNDPALVRTFEQVEGAQPARTAASTIVV
jgi:hypothetical protein